MNEIQLRVDFHIHAALGTTHIDAVAHAHTTRRPATIRVYERFDLDKLFVVVVSLFSFADSAYVRCVFRWLSSLPFKHKLIHGTHVNGLVCLLLLLLSLFSIVFGAITLSQCRLMSTDSLTTTLSFCKMIFCCFFSRRDERILFPTLTLMCGSSRTHDT